MYSYYNKKCYILSPYYHAIYVDVIFSFNNAIIIRKELEKYQLNMDYIVETLLHIFR